MTVGSRNVIPNIIQGHRAFADFPVGARSRNSTWAQRNQDQLHVNSPLILLIALITGQTAKFSDVVT
jgi:hypothetical protein